MFGVWCHECINNIIESWKQAHRRDRAQFTPRTWCLRLDVYSSSWIAHGICLSTNCRGGLLQRISGSNNAAYLQFATFEAFTWEITGSRGCFHALNFRNKIAVVDTIRHRIVLQYARKHRNPSNRVGQNIVKDVKSARAITQVSFISNDC